MRPGPKLRYDLLVLNESGTRVTGATNAHGKQSLQEKIRPGRYFLSVRALHQTSGAYGLTVLTREVSALSSLALRQARYQELIGTPPTGLAELRPERPRLRLGCGRGAYQDLQSGRRDSRVGG